MVNFGLGLAIMAIATLGSFGTYFGVLFFMRSFQTILLLLLAPLFLALGRPLSMAIAVFPRAGRRLDRAIHSRVARVLTFPAITTLALIAVPFAMYFTTWYTASFHSVAVRELTHLALMTPGFVFFWTLLRVDPVPKAYSYAVSLWITGAEVIGDAFLGLAVIASTNLIGGGYYHALARPWGPSLGTDQILGGGTLWIFGDLVGLPFLVAQLIQFIREDESEAAEIDAELDAREAARDAARAARKAAAIAAEGKPAKSRAAAGDATPAAARHSELSYSEPGHSEPGHSELTNPASPSRHCVLLRPSRRGGRGSRRSRASMVGVGSPIFRAVSAALVGPRREMSRVGVFRSGRHVANLIRGTDQRRGRRPRG